jgi:hypothetical protein
MKKAYSGNLFICSERLQLVRTAGSSVIAGERNSIGRPPSSLRRTLGAGRVAEGVLGIDLAAQVFEHGV